MALVTTRHSERSEESNVCADVGDYRHRSSIMRSRQSDVYIMSNRSKTLYTGVTSNLEQRVYEHKHKLVAGFTKRYNLTRLVYFETTDDVRTAIHREKQIMVWLRKRKIELIESMNPQWDDLSEEWYHAQ